MTMYKMKPKALQNLKPVIREQPVICAQQLRIQGVVFMSSVGSSGNLARWKYHWSVLWPRRLALLGSNVLCSCAAEGRRGAQSSAALAVWRGPSRSMGQAGSGSGSCA